MCLSCGRLKICVWPLFNWKKSKNHLHNNFTKMKYFMKSQGVLCIYIILFNFRSLKKVLLIILVNSHLYLNTYFIFLYK